VLFYLHYLSLPKPYEVDYSSAYNDFGGIFNAPNYPNKGAFAALKSDGSIMAWGSSTNGGMISKIQFLPNW
jgi:hypothetical protein